MFSNMPPWMKEILKEFTKPPTFLHHHTYQKTGSSQPKSDKTGGDGDSYSNDGKKKVNRKHFSDDSSSPTDPPAKGKSASRKSKASTKSNGSGFALGTARSEEKDSLHPDYDMRVLQAYPFAVQNASVHQNIIKIETGKDAFLAFKATQLPAERILFMNRALQYVRHKGFQRFSPMVVTKQGKAFVKDGVQTYYVTRWIDGAPVDFSQLTQLGKTADTLARFHESSIGFELIGRHPKMAFDLYQRYLERSQQMASYVHFLQSKSKQTQTDKLIIKHAANFHQQASYALSLLKQPIVLKHLDREEDTPGLCHLDVVERNVIMHPSKQAYLIDFDHMTYAPRVLDLAHLIRRGMQKTDWSSQVALVSLINYNGIRPLAHPEYLILEALLAFPHRWWRLLQMYADTPSASIQPLLETMLHQETNRQQFLRSFSQQVTRHKTVS
ncbi:CotS family spore coat protein [Fodinisporobacter ferrooxydans]|uniref:CotS family spore coat protein n=1 Tax=Fodinisporobacter ferrooxydans TaxID=2901836 RepID=A0ABY4CKD2_9BACL|nr:CotS family spore coat protein [Alicyclobacillaceae bacterium MYW30-H2]